ncbi:hypothetical protein MTO96_020003 [Rhipicephalus appendiculatus]
MALATSLGRSCEGSRLGGRVSSVRRRCNLPTSWELWTTTASHSPEPRPCWHREAGSVRPPDRVRDDPALEKAVQADRKRSNAGPLLPAPGPRGDVSHRGGRRHPGLSRSLRPGTCGHEARRQALPAGPVAGSLARRPGCMVKGKRGGGEVTGRAGGVGSSMMASAAMPGWGRVATTTMEGVGGWP